MICKQVQVTAMADIVRRWLRRGEHFKVTKRICCNHSTINRDSKFEYRAGVIVCCHLIKQGRLNNLPVVVYEPFPLAAFKVDFRKLHLNLSELKLHSSKPTTQAGLLPK